MFFTVTLRVRSRGVVTLDPIPAETQTLVFSTTFSLAGFCTVILRRFLSRISVVSPRALTFRLVKFPGEYSGISRIRCRFLFVRVVPCAAVGVVSPKHTFDRMAASLSQIVPL
ncbi:unnamed protein product [Ectocarpus sp. 4 AP-2014]